MTIKDIIDNHDELMEHDKAYRESFDDFGQRVERSEQAILSYLIHNKIHAGVAMASLTTVLGRVAVAEMQTNPGHKDALVVAMKDAVNELIKTVEAEAARIK